MNAAPWIFARRGACIQEDVVRSGRDRCAPAPPEVADQYDEVRTGSRDEVPVGHLRALRHHRAMPFSEAHVCQAMMRSPIVPFGSGRSTMAASAASANHRSRRRGLDGDLAALSP